MSGKVGAGQTNDGAIVIGIDPGKRGAVVSLRPNGKLGMFDLTGFYDDNGASNSSVNPELLRSWFSDYAEVNVGSHIFVCCEEPIFVGSGFTVKTPMSMFESFGVFRGVFNSFGVPFVGVKPREWQKHFPELYHPKTKRTKDESVKKAVELFPNYSNQFVRVVDKGRSKGNVVLMDGRAEAALIAKYAMDNCKELFY